MPPPPLSSTPRKQALAALSEASLSTHIALPSGRTLVIETEEQAQSQDEDVDRASRQLRQVDKPDLGGWTGGGVWEAGEVLAHLLLAESVVGPLGGKSVIELGCGVGLVGRVAAGLGAARTVLTDQATFMAEWNCAANFSAAERERIEVARLEWGDDDAARQLRPPFDLILASDIIYLSEHHGILASTMAALSGPQTVIYNVAPDHGSTILDPVRESIS